MRFGTSPNRTLFALEPSAWVDVSEGSKRKHVTEESKAQSWNKYCLRAYIYARGECIFGFCQYFSAQAVAEKRIRPQSMNVASCV